MKGEKYGKEDKKTIKITALAGRSYWKMGDYKNGYQRMLEAYEASESYYGPADVDTLNYRRELTMCDYYLGNTKEAYENMVRIYDICLLQYGENHTVTLKTSQNLLEIVKEWKMKPEGVL